MKRLAYIFLVSLLWLALPVLSMASQGHAGPVTVQCPDEVGDGRAFAVWLTSDRAVDPVTVRWLGREITVALEPSEQGGFKAVVFLGWGLALQDPTNTLQVEVPTSDGPVRFAKAVAVLELEYPEEHLTVASNYTSPSEEEQARSARERELVLNALNTVTPERMWQLPFVRPVPGPVTSVFGVRRFFNGEERSPHKGLDLDGETGDPVMACAMGRVILTGDFFYAGGSVYVDHGQGLISMYIHLSEILVQEGDMVEPGQTIGLVGATGRVTGSHLHFGVSALRCLVDPAPFISGQVTGWE